MKQAYSVCLFTVFVILGQCSLRAQWVQCAPVPGDHSIFAGQLQNLAVNGTRLFATRNPIVDTIYYSDNSGATWSVSKLPGVVLRPTTYYPAVAGVWASNGTLFASG